MRIALVEPDVVHVLTPPQTHVAPTLQAVGAGCHVLVESRWSRNGKDKSVVSA